jgi:hypothetical protein
VPLDEAVSTVVHTLTASPNPKTTTKPKTTDPDGDAPS